MLKKSIHLLMLAAMLAGLLTLTPAQPVRAASLVVDTLVDENDGSCVDGDCSLRDAVAFAGGGDVITFSVTGTITLSLGDISVNADITITGPGSSLLTIDANDSSRIFFINSGVTASISGMKLINGKEIGSSGGAIFNNGSLTLDGMTFDGNEAVGIAPFYYAWGGAIYNNGTLTVTNSSFVNNSASYLGGAIHSSFGTVTSLTNVTLTGNSAAGATYPYGGAISVASDMGASSSSLTIADSTINNNTSNYSGGGLYIQNYATASIQNTIIGGNSSANEGGGIWVGDQTLLILTNVTLSDNSAPLGGAGLYGYNTILSIANSAVSGNTITGPANGAGIYLDGASATIRNSTISGNTGAEEGGGVFASVTGSLDMMNSTVSGNSAIEAAGISINGGFDLILENVTVAANTADYSGGIRFAGNQLSLYNSLIADNTASLDIVTDCSLSGGTKVSNGHNLIEESAGGCSASGDITLQDPMLGALANNGGFTQTHALLPGSPAINAGENASCMGDDQRGVTRPAGANCDIGAYEYNTPMSLPNGWVGSVSVTSDKNLVTVGRPHIGSEVASYDGFTSGSLSAYVPMLFKDAFGGSYDAALYIQNLSDANTTNLTLEFYDSSGVLNCTKTDSIAPLASQGYWLPTLTCDTGSLPTGWVGGVKVTADENIVAVGRPHIGSEVMTYNGFSSGSMSAYVPMLFKDAFGGSYDAAFYIQNVGNGTANLTIEYYDSAGTLNCTKADTLAPLASKGYWAPGATCDSGSLPTGWVGGVKITSDQNIVAVGRPHIGTQITTYDGFSSGAASAYVPMLFKDAFGGSYDAAFYLQNVGAATANVTIQYYDNAGTLNCTKADTIAPLASKGYWAPSATCDSGSLPAGWVGGVEVTSDQPLVSVGRPHIDTQVTTYNGFSSASAAAYVPMLFKDAFGGSYDAAFYLQNTEAAAANVTTSFYDSTGALTCSRTDTIEPRATLGFWLPSTTCYP